LRQGLANLDRLRNCVVFAFAGIRILPGTALYHRAIADGLIAADTSLLQQIFYFSPHLEKELIGTAITAAFAGRVDRIFPCHEVEKNIEKLHRMGFIGPLWDIILKKRPGR
jgi:hypothetical protein